MKHGCLFDTEDEFIARSMRTSIDNAWYLDYNRKLLKPFVKGKVLDAGCNVGVLSPLFKSKDYVGVDISKKFIRCAKERYHFHKFIVADLTKKLPFKTNEFDTAMILWTLHHIKNWKSALKELGRVSKRVVIGEVTYRRAFMKTLLSPLFYIINRFTYIRFFTNELGKGAPIKNSLNPSLTLKEKLMAKVTDIFFVQKIFVIE